MEGLWLSHLQTTPIQFHCCINFQFSFFQFYWTIGAIQPLVAFPTWLTHWVSPTLNCHDLFYSQPVYFTCFSHIYSVFKSSTTIIHGGRDYIKWESKNLWIFNHKWHRHHLIVQVNLQSVSIILLFALNLETFKECPSLSWEGERFGLQQYVCVCDHFTQKIVTFFEVALSSLLVNQCILNWCYTKFHLLTSSAPLTLASFCQNTNPTLFWPKYTSQQYLSLLINR